MLRLILLLCLLSPSFVDAATYYVKTTGNDTTGDGSNGNPWLTVPKGLRSLSAGDTLNICAGTYSITGVYGNSASDKYGGGAASWSGATTIKNCDGDTYTINHDGFNMDELVSTGGVSYVIWTCDVVGRCIHNGSGGDQSGFRVNNAAHHVRIQRQQIQNFTQMGIIGGTGSCSSTVSPSNIEILDNILTGNGDNTFLEHAIYPSCSESWVVSGNTIKGNQAYGIHFYASSTDWHRNATIKNNYIEGRKTGATGTAFCIVIATGSGHTVYNNICNGQGTQAVKYSGCFQIYGTMSSPKIYNNTCYDVATGVEVNASVTSAAITNNIFETVTTPVTDNGTSTSRTTNFCDSAGTGCSVTGSPSFTNAATQDFSLQSGSNCRDVGTDLSATLTTDYIGTSRPQNGTFDIGAYEYLVSAGGGGSTGNLGKSSKGLMGGL